VNDAHFEEYIFEGTLINGSEEMINFFELPPVVQSQVEKQINEANEK